jgi:hydrogenase/urease accessory protein HupE
VRNTQYAGNATEHPGHADGVRSGLIHPLMGADHVLAMVAVEILGWPVNSDCGFAEQAYPAGACLPLIR